LEGVEIPPAPTQRSRPASPPQTQPQPAPQEAEPQQAPGAPAPDVDTLTALVAQTVAGLQGSSSGAVTASTLKRTLLRKDPTFNEADYGFRAFGELLRHLAGHNVLELTEGAAKGDPEVTLPEHGDREAAFGLLRSVVVDLAGSDGTVALSGLKNRVRKVAPDFSEKKLGYRSFLQFCRAVATSGAVGLKWSPDADDYLLTTRTEVQTLPDSAH
jgi:OST-HTH/LOTUS domain